MGEPLEQLRDAVSALTGPLTLSPFDDPATVADWTMAIYRCRFKPEANNDLIAALGGSIDAAERFRAAVLPGWYLNVIQVTDGWHVWCAEDRKAEGGIHPSEPIARVLATLSALAKQAPDET